MTAARAFAFVVAAALALFAAPQALAQSCSVLGSGVASWTGVVNTYYPGAGTGAAAGSTSIPVGAKSAAGGADVQPGDLLLIIQMQDASITNSNSTSYGGSVTGGGHTSLGSSGLYEYAVATTTAVGSIGLASPLINTYRNAGATGTSGQKRYQVIRVPQASSATITGDLTAPAWDGATGGVVAVDSAGALTWAGRTIEVSGRGFRGGGAQQSGSNGTGTVLANTDYVSRQGTGVLGTAAVGTVPNGAKGEGVAGTPIIVYTPAVVNVNTAGAITNTGGTDGTSGGYPGGSFGRGAPGNGGGGGTDGDSVANDENTGGAGGGNYGQGGFGGFGWTPGTPPGVDGGGIGGAPVPGAANRLFFGGGGGAGSTNNATGGQTFGRSTSGAAGGGLVFVRAGSTVGAATINARGTNADNSIINDASGGGGAGGSVLVFVDNGGAAVGATINIQGGNGGNNTGGGEPHGPGGGGSGGFAIMSGTATVNAAGGANGITAASPTSTIDYGSTSSVGGFQIVNLTASQIPGAGSSRACFPQLTVTKSTTTPFVASGGTATYDITVTNLAGRSSAQTVTITDPLPHPNITYAATTSITLAGGATRPVTTDPVAPANTPSWSQFTIPGGGSVTIRFTATVAAAVPLATYQNPANVTYLDPTRTAAQTVTPGGTYTGGGTVGGSNYVAASTTNEDIQVLNAPTFTKVFNPRAINVGGVSVLTITIANTSGVALTAAGFVDNYPPGLVNAPAPGGTTTCGGTVVAAPNGTTLTLSGATIPASGSCTVTVNVSMTAPGPYTNTLPAGALTNTQNLSNAVAASDTLFSNVRVAKSFFPTAVAPNADSELRIDITNDNTVPVTINNPGLTDNFPANLVASGGAITYTGAGCVGLAPVTVTAGATTVTLTGGTVPAGGTCRVALNVRSAITGIYANTTTGVRTVENGATTGPASNTANLGVGLVNVSKAFTTPASATIVAGGTATVTLTLNNPTGIAQTGGDLSDTLVNMSVSGNQNTGGTCGLVQALTNGQTAINLTGISVPAGNCTITFVVTSSTVGALTNATTGVQTAALPRGPASNTATLNVITRPTIAKSFAPATISPGGTSTLTFTLTNPGPIALSGAAFTDTYPLGVVNTTPLAVGGTCAGVTTTAAAGGNTFNVTGGNLPVASSCTITVSVTAAAAGSYNNTSSGVTTTQTGVTAGTPSNTANLAVAAPATIAKAFGTSPISQGGTSVVTFTVTNPNPAIALTTLRFTDALTGMALANGTIGGSCAATSNVPIAAGSTSLDFNIPTLAAAGACTVTVTVTSATSGSWPNTTSGVSSAQTPAGALSNTATLVVLSPPVVTKGFAPATIQANATRTTITFTLTNPNATALTNVAFSDPLVNMAMAAVAPAPAVTETCTGAVTSGGIALGGTNPTFSLDTLAANETCTISLSNVMSGAGSSAAGHVNTTSTVTSTQTSINRGAAASANLVVYLPPTVTKVFAPAVITSGGTSVITFTVTNPNAMPLSDIAFADDLPAALSNTAAQTYVGGARGTCTTAIPQTKPAGVIDPADWANINLAAGASCTVMMDVTSATVGNHTNTVTNITSNQTPTATTGGSDTLSVGGVMTLTQTFTPGTIEVGGTATVRWTITNAVAGNNQQNIDLTATLPAGLTAVAGTATLVNVLGTCTFAAAPAVAAGSTVTFTNFITDMDTGDTCAIEFTVTASSPGDKANTVTAPPAGNPASIANATDTSTLIVYQRPTIAKAFTPATVAAGLPSTLTFTLTNAHPTRALTNAAFSDTLANMAISGAQAVGGTCAGAAPANLVDGATALSFTGITIPAGSSCTVTVVVASAVAGTHPNITSGVTTTQTPTAGADSGSVNLVVGGIDVTKAFADATRPAGVATRLTLTLTSTQAVNWTGLAFTDTMPAALVVANPANATTTCGAGTVTATPGSNIVSLSGGTLASGVGPCTVAVDVVSATAGTYNNVAANFSGGSAGMSFAGASASVQYYGAAALGKAFVPTAIGPGGTSVLTFTVTNAAGNPAQSGLGFTDTLPGNVVVGATPGITTNCPAGGGFAAPAFTVTAVAGSGSIAVSGLAMNAAVTSCQVRVNVTSSVPAAYVNNAANLSAFAGGLTAPGISATLNVVGTSLTKTFTLDTVGAGVASTLQFTIANGAGNPAQTGLAFTDSLPTNVVVATPNGVTNNCGGTFTATAGSTSVTLANGVIAAVQPSCTISVNVVSAVPGTYVNDTANISGEPATMSTSGVNATLRVLAAPVAAKSFTPNVTGTATPSLLTITLTNPNAIAITGTGFTDTYPAGLINATPHGAISSCAGATVTAADAGPSVALSGATLPANGSCTVTVNVQAAAAGSFANTIAAGGITSTNAGASTAAANATLTVLTRLTVAKAFLTPSIGVGAASVLQVTLTNTNAVSVTGAAFTDNYPANLLNTAAAGGATTCGGAPTVTAANSGTSLAITGATVPAGGSCVVTVNVTSNTIGSYFNSTGAVTTANAGTATAATATLDVRDRPTVTKAFAPVSIGAGGTSVLTITLGNANGVPLTGVAFTDTYPGGLVNATPAGGASTCAGATVTAADGAGSVAVSGATVPANGTCTVTVTVTAAAAGSYINSLSAGAVTSTEAGANTVAGSSTLTVLARPTITKGFGTNPIAVNGTSTLTITLANSNAAAITGAAFTDTYPANITNSGTPAGATTCVGGLVTAANNGPSVALSGATIPANGSCTVTVQVTASASGSYLNSIGAGALTTTNAGSNSVAATDTLTVLARPTIAKSFAPNPSFVGGTSVLTITLSNANGVALTGAAFSDLYPAGLTNTTTPAGATSCVGGAVTAANNGPSVALSGATIPANGSCTVTVNVTPTASGNLVNTIAAGALTTTNGGSNAAAATDTLAVLARPTIAKSFAPNPSAIGGTSVLTITLSNSNATAITGAAFTDTYPAGLVNTATPNGLTTCVGGAVTAANNGSSVALSGATIPANGSCTVTVNVTPTASGNLVNTIAAGALTTTNGGSNAAAATDTLAVLTRPTITKSFGTNPSSVGGTLVLTITLSNSNATAITGAAFTDTYPAGLTNTSTPAGATTCVGGAVTAANNGPSVALSGATIPANGSCTVTVNVTPTASGNLVNTIAAGALTTTNGGSNAAAASDTLAVLARPTIAKSFAPNPSSIGGASVLTITLSNSNATAITGAAFTDTYPVGLTNTTTPAGATSCVGGAVTAANNGPSVALSGATIPANGSCTVTVNVTPTASGNLVNTIAAGALSTTNGGSNVAAASDTLTVAARPTIAKSFGTNPIAVGGTSLLTIMLSNTNAFAVTGAAFTDTYPAGIQNTATPGGATSCVGGTVTAANDGPSVALSGATIPANGSCTVTVSVTATASGALVNTIAAGALTTTNGGSNAAAASDTLNVLARPTVTKSFAPNPGAIGGTSVLTITLSNTNAVALTGAAFTDTYPAGLQNAGTPAGATSCAGGTVTAANNGPSVALAGATISANGSCTVTVNVTPTASGNLLNTIAAGALTTTNGGSNAAAASDTLVVAARPTIAKAFAPNPIAVGGTSVLTVTLTNTNAFAVTGAAFTDTYPAGIQNTATPAGATSCGGGTVTAASNGPSVALSGATVPANGSCTVTVNVTGTAAGGLANTIPAGALTTTNAGSNAAAASDTLTVLARPTITKSFTPNPAAAGSGVTLTITLGNSNAVAVTGAAFADTYPTNLQNSATPGAVSTCGGTVTAAANGPSVALSGGTIPANGSCMVTVEVTATAAGSFANTIGVGALTTTNAGSNTVAASSTLVAFAALAANKGFAPASVGVNAPSVLNITISNTNNVAATGVAFTDSYPAGLVNTGTPSAVITGTGCVGLVTAAANGNSLSLSGGTVPANSSCLVTVNVTSAAAGAYLNSTGPVTTTNAGTAPADSATLTVLSRPTVTKAFAPNPINVGGTSVLTITIANTNAAAITGATFTDTYVSGLVNTATPAGSINGAGCSGTVTAANNGTSVALSNGNIPANASCTITVNVTAAAAGSYINTLAAGAVTSTNAGSNTVAATDTLLVMARPTIAKAFGPNPIPVNGASVLTITLTNTNATAITGAAFTDSYVAGLVNTGTPAGATSCAGGTVTAANNGTGVALAGGTIPANGACTVTVNVTSAAGGSYANTIAAGGLTTTNAGTNAAAATDTLTVLARPTLAKAFAPNPVPTGGTSVLTLTLGNTNAVAITGAAFTDTYPAGLVNTGTPAGATDCGAGVVTAAASGASVALSGGTIPANGTCTVTVNVTAASAGTFVNTVAAGDLTSTNAGSSTTAATDTLTVSARPTIAKSFGTNPVAMGGTSLLTITLSNSNAFAVTGAAFTDTYPASIQNTATPGGATTCAGGTVTAANNGPSVALSGATIPANGSCTVTVTVTATASGSAVNTIAAGALTTTNAGSNTAAASDTLTVLARPTVTKSFAPNPSSVGGTSVLTITLANANATALTGAAFTDSYPAGLANTATPAGATTCAGGTVTAANNGPSVALSGGTIPANGSCTVTVNVTPTASGNLTNTLAIGAVTTTNGGSNAVAASDTLVVAARPTIAKSFGTNPVAVGGTSLLTITVTNTNATAVTGAAFTDTYPAGIANTATPAGATTCAGGTVTAANNGTSVALSGGTIPANGSCTVTVTITATAAGNQVNTIAAGALTTTNGGSNAAAASDTLTVLARPTVAKAFSPNPSFVGATSVLTITLSNPNATALTGAAFTDSYPVGLANTATPAGATTCAGGAVTAANSGTSVALSGGSIPANGSCTVTVNVTPTASGNLVNTLPIGAVTTTNGGSNAVAGSDTLVVAARPTIAKAFAPNPIAVGGTSVLTITLSNANATAISGAAFTDTYPAGIANSGTPAGATACAGGTVTAASNGTSVALSGGTIPANGSCTVTVNITATAPGNPVNTIAAGALTTTNAGSNALAASDTLVVNARPTVTKSFSPNPSFVGGTSVLTVTLSNANAAAITGAAFTDSYPAGLANTAAPAGATTCAGGTVTAANNGTSVALSGGTIPANGSCTVTVNVTPTASGSLVNTLAAGDVTTTNGGSNAVAAGDTLVAAARPTIAKSFGTNPIAIGGTSLLTITLANTNATAITGAAFTDTYPAGITNSSTPAGATTCAGGTVTAANNGAFVTLSGGTVPANGSCTVTVNVTATASGNLANTIAAGGLTTTNAGSNALSATDTLSVLLRPTVTKSFAPNPAAVGSVSVLTITLANANGTALTGAAFTDSYPAGLANTATPAGATSCGGTVTAAGNGASVSLFGGTIPANGSCTVTVNVTPTASGSLVNTLAIGAVTTTNGGANAVAASDTLVVAARPTITKAFSPNPIALGGTSVLTLTLGNTNASAATGAAFTDTYPANLTNTATPNGLSSCGGTVTAAANGTGITLSGGTIPANGTCTVTVNVTTSASGSFANTLAAGALSTSAGSNAAVTTDTLSVLARPTIAKAFAPNPTTAGGASVLTVTLGNTNAVALTGAAFTDSYPAGLVNTGAPAGASSCGGTVTAVANGTSLALSGGTIPANGTCTVTVNVTAPAGSYANTIAAGALITTNGGASTVAATDTLTTFGTLAVAKTFTPATIGVNGTSVLTITFTNANGGQVTGLDFTDLYPAGLVNTATANASTTCTNGTLAGANSGTSVALTGARVPGNGSCTVTINVTSATPGAYLNSTGTVTTNNAGTAPADTATLTVLARPSATKSFAPISIGANGTSILTVTISNANAAALTGVAFTDTYPAGLVNTATPGGAITGAGCSGTVTAAAAGNTLALGGATIPANGSCAITVAVTAATPGSYLNTLAAGAITSLEAGASTAAASGTLTVLSAPAVAKSFAAASMGAGGTNTVTITLTNANASAITGVAFTDTFPSGMVNVTPANAATGCGGTLTAANGSGSVALAGGTIPANGSCTVTADVTVAIAGSYTNTLAAGAVTTTNAGSNTAAASATVTALNALMVAKSFAPASIGVNGASVLTITFTNANGTAVTGVSVNDAYPANLVNTASAGGTNTCGGALTAANNGTSLQLAGGTVAANSSCAISVNVTSATAGSYLNSTGTITTANAGGTSAATATLDVLARPTVAKSFAAASIGVNDTTTLTVTLANANATALTGAAFSDSYPAGLVNAGSPGVVNTCGGTVTAAGSGTSLVLSGGTIPANGSCSVTVTVTSAATGSYANTLAAGSVTTTNGGASAVAASSTLEVLSRPAIAKAFSPTSVGVGQAATLTITLSNANAVAIAGAAFTDSYPSGLANSTTPGAATTCAGASITAAAGGGSIAVSGATIPANGSCTVTVSVTPSATGTYNNTIVAGALTSFNAGASTAAASATLDTLGAPTATKAFGPSTIAVNGVSVLTITLSNANAFAITGAGFTDSYPAGLLNTGTPAGATTCAGGTVTAAINGASVALAGGTIPANGSCTVTANVTAAAAGSYVNTTGAIASGNAGSGTAASGTLRVFAAPTVSKSFSPTSIVAGGTSTMTIVVTNPGANPAALTGVVISDVYPAGLTNAAAGSVACSAGGSATLTGGVNAGTSVGFNAGTIAAGGTCTVTQLVSASATVINTTGTATSNEANAGTAASATLTVALSPTIAKAFSPTTVVIGGTSTITFTIANPNATALTGGAFTDALTGMVIDVNGAATGSCTGAAGNVFTANQANLAFTGLTLPASASCTVSVVVRATAVGSLNNTASGVATNQAATGAVSNTATLTVTAAAPTVTKIFSPATIDPGATSQLTITLGNANNVAYTVTGVTDTFPAGMNAAAVPNAITSCAGGTVTSNATSVTLTSGTVPANGSCTVTIDVTSATSGASLVNTIPAGALTTSIGANTAAGSATLTVRPQADLAIVKSGPASVAAGATVTYTLVISNAGPQPANGALFSDTVPAAVFGVAASCAAAGGAACGAVNVSGNTVTSTVATLPPGGTVTITITGFAPNSGSFTNTAQVLTPPGTYDPTDPTRIGAGNNQSSATTSIVSPDLRLTKTHVGSFIIGTNGTYTITVDNALGAAPTTGTITVTDNLPNGLGFVSGTGTGWTCGAAGQLVTCTSNAVIAAGATSANPITLVVSVANAAAPSVTNTATVSGGGEPAAAAGNNTASDSTGVTSPGVSTFAPDNTVTASAGTTVNYPHTFNAGVAGTLNFSTASMQTPAVAGWTQVIYRDNDCNGSLNGADGAAPISGGIAVAAGDIVCIIVRDAIPITAPQNAQNAITVTATLNAQAFNRTDVTIVGAGSGAGLVLNKQVRNVTQGGAVTTANTARPNDVLEYTITYTNTGAGPVSAIVVTDSTPSFTVYQAAMCVVPLPANISSCNLTTQPALNGTGSVSWTLGGSLVSGASGTVSYTVRVVP